MAIESTTVVDSSGIAHAAQCYLHDVTIGGLDGTNDMVVTIYDNASAASGTVLVPTHTIDASALGLNGITFNVGRGCKNGVYVEISGGGTVDVTCGIEGW